MSEGCEVIWWEDKQLKNPNYTRIMKHTFYAINKPLKTFQMIFISGNSYTCRPQNPTATEDLFDKLIELYNEND